MVGAAQVNWRPARVFRMGMNDKNSGTGYFSNDETGIQFFRFVNVKISPQFVFYFAQPNFCLASLNTCSHWVRLSGFENITDILWMPFLCWKKKEEDKSNLNIRDKGCTDLTSSLEPAPKDSVEYHLFVCRTVGVELLSVNL